MPFNITVKYNSMFDQDQLGLSCVSYHTPTPPATHRVLLVLTQVN